MRTLKTAITLLSICVCFTASYGFAAPAPGGKVAVLDIQATGLTPQQATLLTEILSTEIASLNYFESVTSGADIATMMGFERQKDLLGCTDGECLAELGGALGVDRIIGAHVGKIGSSYIVQLKLINIVNQNTERRIYKKLEGGQDELVQTIKSCSRELILPESSDGPGAFPWLMTTLGLVAVGGGIYFGLEASNLEQSIDKASPGSQLEAATAQTYSLYANIGFGAAALSTAIASIIWITHSPNDSMVASSISAAPTDGGAMIHFGRNF